MVSRHHLPSLFLFFHIIWLSYSFVTNTIPFNEIKVKKNLYQLQGELLYFINFCISLEIGNQNLYTRKLVLASIKIILLIEWLAQVFILKAVMGVVSPWLFLRIISFYSVDAVSVATCSLDLLILKKWAIISYLVL